MITVGRETQAPPVEPYVGWITSSLVWLPEYGMGSHPVPEPASYDAEYFAKYAGYADTPMGRAITRARCELVRRHMRHGGTLCDVGIGCGDFIESVDGVHVYGYDINPTGVEWLERRKLWLDPYETPVDAVTMFDSLEHIPDVARIIANARSWVFASLPIVPGDGPPPRDWKHLRRDEHCWYFTLKGFIRWMGAQGFETVEASYAESLLGRDDVFSFACRRVQPGGRLAATESNGTGSRLGA